MGYPLLNGLRAEKIPAPRVEREYTAGPAANGYPTLPAREIHRLSTDALLLLGIIALHLSECKKNS